MEEPFVATYACRQCETPLKDEKAAKMHILETDGLHFVEGKVGPGSFVTLNDVMK